MILCTWMCCMPVFQEQKRANIARVYAHTHRSFRHFLPRLIYMDVLYAGFAGAKTGHINQSLFEFSV